MLAASLMAPIVREINEITFGVLLKVEVHPDRAHQRQGCLGSEATWLNWVCSSVFDQYQQNKSGFRLVALLFLSCLIIVKHFSKCPQRNVKGFATGLKK